MHVDLVRSGGFANVRLRRSLDTDDLSPQDAQELEELVARVDLDDLERRSPIRGRGADRFQYDLTVMAGERERRISVGEGALPPELRALIDRVLEHEPGGRR